MSGNTKQCKQCRCEARRSKLPGQAGLQSVYRNYRYAAEQREYEFLLTREEFKEIATQDCYWCGSPPVMITGAKNSKERYTKEGREHSLFTHNGVDRYDNTKGYTLENSVPCCTHCNRAKQNLTPEQFKILVVRIYERICK